MHEKRGSNIHIRTLLYIDVSFFFLKKNRSITGLWVGFLFFSSSWLCYCCQQKRNQEHHLKEVRIRGVCLLFPIFKPMASTGEMSLKFRLVAIQGVSR